MLEEVPAFEYGLCNTTGSVYGQSGSVDTSDQFAIGISTGDWSFSAGLNWQLYDDVDNNRTAIGRNITSLIRRTGSFDYNYPGTSYELSTFCNSYIDTSSYRTTNIVRFFTGSNLGDATANPERMSMTMLWVDAATTPTYNDVSASSQLASLLTASTWSELVTAANTLGYSENYLTSFDSHSVVPSIDGVYFSWYRMFDNLDLSDVVLRRVY